MVKQVNVERYIENTKDFEAIRKIVRDESDRAAAILGGAYLDTLLADLLRHHLISHKGTKGLLEDRNSPLSTFSAKIDMCFALGLLPELVWRDLDLIRKIRNYFAHDLTKHSFDESPLKDWCRAFNALRGYPDWEQWKRPDLYRRLFELGVYDVASEINTRISYTPNAVVPQPYGSLYQKATETLSKRKAVRSQK